jgi:hypothetical protein
MPRSQGLCRRELQPHPPYRTELLRKETSKKRGIKGKRLNAAWDHDYLLKLLIG